MQIKIKKKAAYIIKLDEPGAEDLRKVIVWARDTAIEMDKNDTVPPSIMGTIKRIYVEVAEGLRRI